MRIAWLALFCFGAAALSQSPAPKKSDPDNLFQLPDKFAQQAPDVNKLKPRPFQWNKLIPGSSGILTPRPEWKDPQIDPKIIIRPPWRNQSRGQDVAHRVYPNLKFLPLRPGPKVR